ncbi:MAG TPA: hypothetical protein VH108_07215 [Gaiellaceae bacterium]|jgi:hypothetical protein|nr:hypothetical protein [Gaiellaceae bacterium]
MKISRELAHRHQDGLEVTLLWDDRSNEVWIELADERTESAFAFGVDAKFALDAFYHPYAYTSAVPPIFKKHRQLSADSAT